MMHRRRASIRLSVTAEHAEQGGFLNNAPPAPSSRRFSRNAIIGYLCLSSLSVLYLLFAVHQRFYTEEKLWPAPFKGGASTLVYQKEDLRSIWEWEVAAGHYPSRQSLPAQLAFRHALPNPARPKQPVSAQEGSGSPSPSATPSTVGIGSPRGYFMNDREENFAYPPRPVPGSIADMDVIMDHCDFATNQYVRDCLRVLREGAGLMNVPRRDRIEDEAYIYTEDEHYEVEIPPIPRSTSYAVNDTNGSYEPRLNLPPLPRSRRPQVGCDDANPWIFHVFWNGPFTDKPYMAILSFLYTQNLGLHLDYSPSSGTTSGATTCHPQLWVWVNFSTEDVRAGTAEKTLQRELEASPWSAPFLHPRFREAVKFKVWNTEEQLDAVPELRGEWRVVAGESLLRRDIDIGVEDGGELAVNSTITSGAEPRLAARAPAPAPTPSSSADSSSAPPPPAWATGMRTYDKLSVMLSDLVRFVLCHTHGGIYLDMDTLLLRDWSELFSSPSAFAYRWSRLDRYNTAVLRLHKRSALGTLLLRSALRNELKFHPIDVGRYVRDASVEELLWRLADALFDPAWLGTEGYQRDRPPMPYFERFEEFFETPALAAAAPEALGFDGFFKGAFSYHYHNSWWTPFDRHRNFPDLGPQFPATSGSEYLARPVPPGEDGDGDLSWAAVLKRTFEAYVRGERPNMYGEGIRY